MQKNELLSTLEKLHQDLSQAEVVNPEAEDLLRAVTKDIHRLLDDDQESPDNPQSLSDRLENLMQSWEDDHPQIAQLIGQTAEALANFGI